MRDLELPDFAALPDLPLPPMAPKTPYTRAEIMEKMAAAHDRFLLAEKLIVEAQDFIKVAIVRREELHKQLWILFHYSFHATDYST